MLQEGGPGCQRASWQAGRAISRIASGEDGSAVNAKSRSLRARDCSDGGMSGMAAWHEGQRRERDSSGCREEGSGPIEDMMSARSRALQTHSGHAVKRAGSRHGPGTRAGGIEEGCWVNDRAGCKAGGAACVRKIWMRDGWAVQCVHFQFACVE